MTTNLPALPVASLPGQGFQVHCPDCEARVTSDPGGLCPQCGLDLSLPSLPSRRDRLPPRLRQVAETLEPGFDRLAEWFRQSPWLFVFFWSGLLWGASTGSFLLLLSWGYMVDRLFPPRLADPEPVRRLRLPSPPDAPLPEGATPRPRLTDLFSTRAELVASWWQVNQIRRRRGVSVHLDVRVLGFQGHRLELELRFLGPDGRFLRTPLSAYRGPRGEALAQHRTRPLRHDDSRFQDLWIYLPLRALGLPRGLVRLEATAEIRLVAGRTPLLTHLLPVDLIPMEEDLWEARGGSLSPGEGLLLESVHEASDLSCGVCADPIEEEPVCCPVCQAPHHPECWAYLDGCSRFGCPESPARRGS